MSKQSVRPVHEASERKSDVERIGAFSDAVFAFSLTVLAIEIKVPIVTGDPKVELPAAMLEQAPHLISFVVGFLVVALYWAGHHRIFRQIERVDGRLVWLNLFLLMFIAFMPVATAYLGEYPDVPLIPTIYALVLTCISIVELLLLRHVASHNMLDPDVSPRLVSLYQLRILAPMAIFLLSIPVAYLISANAAELSWALIWPASILVSRSYRDVTPQIYG